MSSLTHFVVTEDATGRPERSPLKAWLRENPDVLSGIDPSTRTTHQLRAMLRRRGWQQQAAGNDVVLLQPGLPYEVADDYITALEADETQDEPDDELAFELEHQLRDFLVTNLAAIPVNGKRLGLFVDNAGRTGREYPTEAGFIDVLAKDEVGALYVFELKRGRTSDHTVGQVLRYMGWCKQNICEGRPVFGVIVAQSHNEKLKFAASVVPNLSVFEYEVSFRLRPVSIG